MCYVSRNIKDENQYGRPYEEVTEENIEKLGGKFIELSKLIISERADMSSISYTSVYSVLYEHLGMKKLSTRWVPRLLTVDQKQTRVDISKHCSDAFGCV